MLEQDDEKTRVIATFLLASAVLVAIAVIVIVGIIVVGQFRAATDATTPNIFYSNHVIRNGTWLQR